jgi:hypothetical protein
MEWVTTRLTARSGLACRDPRRLVGGSPTVTHAAQPTAQKPGERKKKKKTKKMMGDNLMFLSYFLKIQ